MKLVTAQQMRELEQRAVASGNSYAQMMERAGTLTAQAILEEWNVRDQRVLVLIGPGNNGGDGLVCARVLHDAGASVRLYVWKRVSDENDTNWQLCQQRSIPVVFAADDADFSQTARKTRPCGFHRRRAARHGRFAPDRRHAARSAYNGTCTLSRTRATPELVSPDEPVSAAPHHPHVIAIDLPTGLNPDTGELRSRGA